MLESLSRGGDAARVTSAQRPARAATGVWPPFATGLWSLALAVILCATVPAPAAIGPWLRGDHFQLRLMATGQVGAANIMAGAVEIGLAAGWDTYWRTPGQGGVAPVFDFSQSTNIVTVAVRYPFPKRFDDGVTVANVYVGGVVLPLDIVVADPSKPAVLALRLDLGVCKEICIPARASASLTIPAGRLDAEAAAAIEAAGRLVPAAPQPGAFQIDGAARTGGPEDRPQFEIHAHVPDAAVLFVEGPPDWYAGAPKIVGSNGREVTFTVSIDRLGSKTKVPGALLRFTLVSGERAIEQTITLD